MARRLSRKEAAALPLLRGEFDKELARMIDSLVKELRPEGPILQLLVNEYAYSLWEICRIRRWKIATIENAFYDALKYILGRVVYSPSTGGVKFEKGENPENVNTLAQKWFLIPAVKAEILEVLGLLGLDETNIQAEAVRRSSDTLEALDRMMALAENRRDKALRTIAEYRAGFAARLNNAGQQIIEGKAVEIEHPVALPDPSAA